MRFLLVVFWILLLSASADAANMCETALILKGQSIKFKLLHDKKHLRILEVPRFPEEVIEFSDVTTYIEEIEAYLEHIADIRDSLSEPRQLVLDKDLNSLYKMIRIFKKQNKKGNFDYELTETRLLGFRNQIKGLSFETYVSLQLLSMSFVHIERSITTGHLFQKKFLNSSNNVELDFTGQLNGTKYWFEFKSVKPMTASSRQSTARSLRKQIKVRKALLRRFKQKDTKLIVVLKFGLGETQHQSFLDAGADQVIALDAKPLRPRESSSRDED